MKPGHVRHAAHLSRWSFREGDPGVSVFQNSPNDEVAAGEDRRVGKASLKVTRGGDMLTGEPRSFLWIRDPHEKGGCGYPGHETQEERGEPPRA